MTTLAITPNWKNKTAKFKGTIAAGEHVAVSIANDDNYITDTTNLRLRVVNPANGKTLAQFPMPVEVLPLDALEGDGTGEADETWDSDLTPLQCTLDLNTDRMLMAVPPAANVPLLFVLDAYEGATDEDEGEFTLYFKDMCEVTHWPRRVGEDEPTRLDDYKDLIEDFKTRLTDAEGEIGDAVIVANAAASAVAEVAGDLAGAFTAATYNSTTKKIVFTKQGGATAEIDASAFIKDGMVSSVYIGTGADAGKLVIVFNADAQKETIKIPLTDIFNPSNYYDKTAADGKFVAKETGKRLMTDAEGTKLSGIEAGAKDNVVEAASASAFPQTGATGKIYVAKDDNKTYRWNGSQYVQIGGGGGSSVDVVPPSADQADAGKAADAKATGDALAAKLGKSGGTMTGNLTVQADNAAIRVVNTDSPASPYTELQDGKIIRGNEFAQTAEIALPNASGVAALLENIAPDFADSASYAVGDLTVYGGALYRCTTAHQGGWAAADFAVCTVEDVLAALRLALAGKASVSDVAAKAAQTDIAPEFDAEDSYQPGQFVYHEGTLYYCINEHEGAWSDLDFVDSQTISSILLEVKQRAETTDDVVVDILTVFLPSKLDGEFVANPYDGTTSTYNVGDKVSYGGSVYQCTSAVATPKPFDPADWVAITLAEYLAAKQDALSAAQLANIAAVPSKADAADLRYALVTKTIANDAVTLDDRASNEVVIPAPDSEATEVTLTLNLPAAVSGRARDLLVRLDLTNVPTTGVDISGISFAPASGETPTYEVKGNAWPENEVGKVNLWSFTETKDGSKWAVGRETLTAVTQGGAA